MLYYYFYYLWFLFFFFNDTATTEIYTLSLHDALPISVKSIVRIDLSKNPMNISSRQLDAFIALADRKSTRLNSSHLVISYAVFCLKKKNYLLVQVSSSSVLPTVWRQFP